MIAQWRLFNLMISIFGVSYLSHSLIFLGLLSTSMLVVMTDPDRIFSLSSSLQNITRRLLLGRDFNALLHQHDHRASSLYNHSKVVVSCHFVDSLSLLDLGCSGFRFTWNNRRNGMRNVHERLDRFLANSSWEFSTWQNWVLTTDPFLTPTGALELKELSKLILDGLIIPQPTPSFKQVGLHQFKASTCSESLLNINDAIMNWLIGPRMALLTLLRN